MRLCFKLLAVLFAAAIFYLSFQPASGLPGPPYADKVQHALAYAILTILMALGWPKIRLPGIVCMAIIFGVGVEIAQGMGAQGRIVSVHDAIANGVGAGFAALVVRFFRQ